MSNRFFSPTVSESGSAVLEGGEAHHLIHVLRAKVGDEAELFNGCGLVAQCRISTISKREIQFEILSAHQDIPPERIVTLVCAVPKGDRFDWLIEKATELGVSRFVPLVSERSIVEPRETKLDKIRSAVIAACKQSGRSYLMEIAPLTSWSEALKMSCSGERRLIAHPAGKKSNLSDFSSVNQPVSVLIGPEGGFTEPEFQTAIAAGIEPIQLGRQILRIETAAIAVAAKLLL